MEVSISADIIMDIPQDTILVCVCVKVASIFSFILLLKLEVFIKFGIDH